MPRPFMVQGAARSDRIPQESSVPNLVNRATVTGNGQLARFGQGLSRAGVADWALFLILVEEASLMNLHTDVFLGAAVEEVTDFSGMVGEPLEGCKQRRFRRRGRRGAVTADG